MNDNDRIDDVNEIAAKCATVIAGPRIANWHGEIASTLISCMVPIITDAIYTALKEAALCTSKEGETHKCLWQRAYLGATIETETLHAKLNNAQEALELIGEVRCETHWCDGMTPKDVARRVLEGMRR